jgi:anti-anti-sigma regulatory factor
MTTTSVWSPVTGKETADSLRTDAVEMVKATEGELLLDFSSVARIGSDEIRALKELADLAQQRAVKLRIRNIKASIYKSLTLLKLARRFTFSS